MEKNNAYKDLKKWRKRTKERLVKALGGECVVCGYNKSIAALDFHHIEDKKFTIASAKINNWKRIVEETKKCILLCSNCHREYHVGLFCLLIKNIPRFNLEYENYRKGNDDFFEPCPICEKLKPKSQYTCSSKCGAKRRTKIDWDKIDLIELYKKYKSYLGVAKFLGVSDVTVRKRILRIQHYSLVVKQTADNR